MWGFNALREQAIKQLDTSDLNAIRRFHLSQKYDIPGWIPKSYTELVDRKERLTPDESKELGLEVSFEISQYREQKLEQLVTHFKTEHGTARVCTSGHDNSVSHRCRKSSCGCAIKLEVNDGCEVFDVPGAPSRKKPKLASPFW